ncbi:MAG: rhodanese-like domain-containing protein [Promethearchaeota archaeon]
MEHNETFSTDKNEKRKQWIVVITSIVLIGSFATATYLLTPPSNPDTDGENTDFQRTDVTVEVAYQMIMNSSGFPDLIIMDVRTHSEFVGGHLNNSVLMPVDEIEANIDELLQYQNTTILVYCRSGNRSGTASDILLLYNFSRIYNMLGGYSDWVASEYPTVM